MSKILVNHNFRLSIHLSIARATGKINDHVMGNTGAYAL